MAKRKPVSNRVQPGQFKPRNTYVERRDASGLGDRLISELPPEALFEITATWLTGGVKDVQQKYGLTDGELMQLAKDPQWVALISRACNAQRASVVHRMLQTMHASLDAAETLLAAGKCNIGEVMDIMDKLGDQISKLGGIEQKVAVTHNLEAFNAPAAPAVPTLTSDELGKLQTLDNQLKALAGAGVRLGTPENQP